MLTTDNSPRYTILDLGFDKNISKQLFAFEEAPPEMQNLFLSGQASKNLLSGEVVSKLEQIAGVLFNGKGSFTSTTAGYRLGIDTDEDFKFAIGDAINSMDWNVTTADTLTIVGAISASTITGGTFQTAASGRRVKIDSTTGAITFYNASDVEVGRLGGDPATYSLIYGVLNAATSVAMLSLTKNPGTADVATVASFLGQGSHTGTTVSIQNDGVGTRTSSYLLSLANAGTGNGLLISDNSTNSEGTPLTIIQSKSTNTNPAIKITQSAVTSTNFRKFIQETITGVTIWISNGTDPNGALTGAAGDVCLNGATNKPAYCTGTTNWTNFV